MAASFFIGIVLGRHQDGLFFCRVCLGRHSNGNLLRRKPFRADKLLDKKR